MKAYQIMEEILEELSIFEDLRSTITNKYGPMFGDKSTPEGGRLHGKAIEANVNEIVSAAKRNLPDEEKNSMTAIEKEMGKIGARRNNTKNKIGEYRTRARNSQYRNFPVDWNSPKTDAEKAEGSIKRKFKKDRSFPVFQALRSLKSKQDSSEALDIMEEILLEASPLEVKRRIANEFKDKIGDMYNKAVEDDKKNSEEKMNLHNKIHGEGGNTVVVMGDKIEDFSDNPEIRKDQEKFNEVTDKSKKSGEKVHKLGNLKNLVDYYKNEALELTEAIINEFTEADKKEAAKKVLPERKKEYLSKYAQVLDAADEVGSENVPDGNLKDLERAEKRYKHAEKVANEALSLAESIIGYADNIFELDYENKQNVNTNKIRKLKKDKDGENVEVVSVADELFPYEGNAKQQFNQKVLAKINDMIEGKGSLEDLIQFVRKYSGNKKVANESTEISEAVKLLEEMISTLSDKIEESTYSAAKYANPFKREAIHNKALNLYVKELEGAAKRNLPKEKRNSFSAVNTEMNKIAAKRGKSPIEVGIEDERAEDAKNNPYSLEHTIRHHAIEGSKKRAYKKGKIANPAKWDPERVPKIENKVFTSWNKASEALEEIKQVVEGLFVNDGRGDLLNDIDNALGSPVKKTAKDMVKQCTGCKQKKVK